MQGKAVLERPQKKLFNLTLKKVFARGIKRFVNPYITTYIQSHARSFSAFGTHPGKFASTIKRFFGRAERNLMNFTTKRLVTEPVRTLSNLSPRMMFNTVFLKVFNILIGDRKEGAAQTRGLFTRPFLPKLIQFLKEQLRPPTSSSQGSTGSSNERR